MTRRHVRVVGAMLQNEMGRYLITQRPPTASLPLLWEFPGGRVEEGEHDTAALARELHEEMGVRIEVLEQVMHTHHEYPTYDIDFRVFRCRLSNPDAEIHHLRVHDHRWVALEEMGQYRFPDADAKTLARLLDLDH
ncbi:(deoxy)nucleoside triphosphate pyrophosphohydrolase [Corallococcus sp. AB049A]|uniref:8-oxo-dGTP diphosphatase n=1 Tax=Corallococcus interemptor TaxID=2316720 RepID=A0A3A8QLH9_9BACT|nr:MULTISPECIES: (deoxy)nucleoside triphosphate pyrophosphohydrolase [Corallococcus]RKH49003.1 (deoxy)nucleoside triphosphate pyrophosphohydrolase [Corallococcus sp. AB050B]RKH69629.1 (deoxy)nucleoside triphosphate pyrophosphohydrolase [Corallococcus interemptor]RKI66460.1 (deoxy)nucleoside triphosphate pyrophosphohydrolase [Corallococcus sp. AB049A]